VEIRTIDMVSDLIEAGPFLVAMTAEPGKGAGGHTHELAEAQDERRRGELSSAWLVGWLVNRDHDTPTMGALSRGKRDSGLGH
jgi:hypothetical protein